MNIKPHSIAPQFAYKFSFDINDLIKDWSCIQHSNTYLTPQYLIALENSKQPYLSFVYVVIYHHEVPVGIMYFQCLEITHQFYFQDTFPKEINQKLSTKLLKSICGNLLMCGNFFATGVNGFVLNATVPKTIATEVVKSLKKELKKLPSLLGTSFIMFKEFGDGQEVDFQKELIKSYTPFEIDVNMVLYMDESWNTFSDYLESMTTKYRTRAKNAYKKTTSIEQREFAAKEIKEYNKEIHQLYLSVVNTASFNMVPFTNESFYQLKKALQNKFIFTGYFMGNELVAFSTACLTNDGLDANYVGINYSLNETIPLYQRVLYDYVKLAVFYRVKELRLGRTAEIMKSSLGATPLTMSLYLKHSHKMVNALLKPILKNIKPTEYEVRKPFKTRAIT